MALKKNHWQPDANCFCIVDAPVLHWHLAGALKATSRQIAGSLTIPREHTRAFRPLPSVKFISGFMFTSLPGVALEQIFQGLKKVPQNENAFLEGEISEFEVYQ